MHIETREPPMSVVPRISVTEPSVSMLSVGAVSPPQLNQKPQAMPRPWFFPSGAGIVRMVLRRFERLHEADRPEGRAVDRLVPSTAAFLSRKSIASMPILAASSSMALSTPKTTFGTQGARKRAPSAG